MTLIPRVLVTILVVAGCTQPEAGTLRVVNHSIQVSNNIFRVDAAPCGSGGVVGLKDYRYNLLDVSDQVISLGSSRDFSLATGCYDVTIRAGFFTPFYKNIKISAGEVTTLDARF